MTLIAPHLRQLLNSFFLTPVSTEQDVKGGGPNESPGSQRYSVKKVRTPHVLGVGARVGACSLNLHAFVASRNMISTHQPQSADLGFVSQAVIQPQLVGIKCLAALWQARGGGIFFFQ